MKIKKLILKNIRSYETEEILFPEGALLLSGDVGSGKTSILLAIEYALFGLQPGQTGYALLRNNSRLGEVSLELEIDGQEIIIERKLKRGKTITNDYSSISINGEKIECAVTELKTKILKLLGYPQEFLKKNNLLYRYTVYTPQEQMKQIIMEDFEVRLNILRHIFGIDKYKLIRENLNLLLARIKEDSKVLQGEIKDLDSEKNRLSSTISFLSSLEEKIKEQENKAETAKSKRKYTETQVSELESKTKEKEKLDIELEKTKVFITTKKDSLYTIKKEYSELSNTIFHLEKFNETDLTSVIKEIGESSKNLETLNSKYIEVVSEINSSLKKKAENLEKKERVFKIDLCPTCLQDVPEAHKHNIFHETEKQLTEISKNITALEEKKSLILNDISKEKSRKANLEEKKYKLEVLKSKNQEAEKTKKKLSDLEKNKESIEKDITLLQKHFDSLKDTIASYYKYYSLYKSKQDNLKQAFQEEKNEEIYLAELKKELQLTNNETIMLKSKISEKEFSKSKLENLLSLYDWLSTSFVNLIDFIERNILLKLRLEFSKLFSKWFTMIAGEGFEVQLDENFTPLILHQGAEMEYSFLSGGERTAVALAYRLALNQTINSIMSQIKTKDIVILDEPTDGFSDAQIEKIRDIFKELSIKQLIIVSHEQKIEGFVDKVLKIKKSSDVSFIEE